MKKFADPRIFHHHLSSSTYAGILYLSGLRIPAEKQSPETGEMSQLWPQLPQKESQENREKDAEERRENRLQKILEERPF